MTDSILFWNAVALEANRVSHTDPDKKEQTGPTLSSRAIAIVHLAMYDAYAAIIGGPDFPRYLAAPPPVPAPPPPQPNSSPANAVAGAAHTTLSDLYKAQRAYFDGQLSCFDQTDPFFQFGVHVGEALLALRKNDPDARDCGYQFSRDRGRHRVDPDNPGQGFHAPFYGAQSNGFAISQRWGLNPPPFGDGKKAEYLTALEQVLAEGIKPELMGTLPGNFFNDRRTPEQTTIGIYWAYDGANGLGTPPRLYNQIIRLIAMKRSPGKPTTPNTEGQNAQLFAFVNAAMGDAGILSWEQKYCHDFWRPVVGIREHDKSFGPAATNKTAANSLLKEADPFWLPLGGPRTNTSLKNETPPFPAYPSGHATFGAAAFHISRLFYQRPPGNRKPDDLFDDLAFVSDELNGGNRNNTGTVRPRHARNFKGGLWEMIIENATSRVYLGVHWIFDAFAVKNGKPDLTQRIGGVRLGLDIAEDIFKHGNGKAPKMSAAAAKPPLTTPDPDKVAMPTVPTQPASVKGCIDEQKKKGGGSKEPVKNEYLSGTSPR